MKAALNAAKILEVFPDGRRLQFVAQQRSNGRDRLPSARCIFGIQHAYDAAVQQVRVDKGAQVFKEICDGSYRCELAGKGRRVCERVEHFILIQPSGEFTAYVGERHLKFLRVEFVVVRGE